MSTVLLFIFSILFQQGTKFESQLANYMNKNLSSYQNFEYEIVQIPDSYKNIELLKPNDFNLSGDMVYLPVRIEKKDGRIIKSILTIKVKIFKNVLIAGRQIDRKEKLNAGDFIDKKMDITQIKGEPVYSPDNIETYRSKTVIKSGEALVSESLERIPVINVGDEINAKYVSGNVMVNFRVFARQEGVEGEIITVISKDKKLFKGKVIDSKTLNIVE